MKRKCFSGALPACAAMLLTCLANLAHASDKLNFSGKYIVESAKNTPGGESDSTLEIVQNDDSIEITRLELGKKTISRRFSGVLLIGFAEWMKSQTRKEAFTGDWW